MHEFTEFHPVNKKMISNVLTVVVHFFVNFFPIWMTLLNITGH